MTVKEKNDSYEVYGYKAFNKDHTNRYNMLFESGKKYSITGKVKFGIEGNGFHFCENLSDVFRYFDSSSDNVSVAVVKGSGKIIKYDDDYYGYYNMYVAQTLTVCLFLSRQEIVEIMLQEDDFNTRKFIQTFKLNDDEKEIFLEKYSHDISMTTFINYYQNELIDQTNNIDAYNCLFKKILSKKYPQ